MNEKEATVLLSVDGCDEESVGRGGIGDHLAEGVVAFDRHDLQTPAVLGVPEANLAIARVGVELVFGKWIEEAPENAGLVSNLGMSDSFVHNTPMSFSNDNY